MRTFPIFFRALTPFFLSFLFLPFSARTLHSQATPAASRTNSFSAFGAYSRVSTDRNSQTNNGFTIGADITRYMRNFNPSLEMRLKFAPGGADKDGENTYGGGIRIEHRFKDFYPYADFLCSYGVIKFNHPNPSYTQDNSVVYSPGLGIDYSVTSTLAVRIDYQFESWKTGKGVSFAPRIFSVGVVYRVPFRSYTSP